MEFGVQGGLAFHHPAISMGESFPVDGRLGFAGGGFWRIRVGGILQLEIDAMVTEKSYASPELVTDTPVETLWLDAPVMAELPVWRSSPLRPAIYGGAQMSFRLRARRSFRGEEHDVSRELKDADYGLVLGGKVAPGDHLSIEGRYELGLKNVDDTNWYEIHTRTLRLLVGYRF